MIESKYNYYVVKDKIYLYNILTRGLCELDEQTYMLIKNKQYNSIENRH